MRWLAPLEARRSTVRTIFAKLARFLLSTAPLGAYGDGMAQATSMSRAVAEEVTNLRKQLGISERALSAETRIPLTTLRRYLAGDDPFRIDRLEHVCGVLGTDVVAVAAVAQERAA